MLSILRSRLSIFSIFSYIYISICSYYRANIGNFLEMTNLLSKKIYHIAFILVVLLTYRIKKQAAWSYLPCCLLLIKRIAICYYFFFMIFFFAPPTAFALLAVSAFLLVSTSVAGFVSTGFSMPLSSTVKIRVEKGLICPAWR